MFQFQKPTLKNLTSENYGQPAKELPELLKNLGRHHIGSFNYMLDEGLKLAVEDIEPVEFLLETTGQKVKIWIIDAK
jgi:hypothetical protein